MVTMSLKSAGEASVTKGESRLSVEGELGVVFHSWTLIHAPGMGFVEQIQ